MSGEIILGAEPIELPAGRYIVDVASPNWQQAQPVLFETQIGALRSVAVAFTNARQHAELRLAAGLYRLSVMGSGKAVARIVAEPAAGCRCIPEE